ncbi:hypothetical protein GCM10020258_18540 [Sphingomonas yabuuchiae]
MKTRLHLHLLSDSTGETLENIAKAALAQYDDVETVRHFWPMVRTESHLERILQEIAQNPGLVIYTLVNPTTRRVLESRCHALGLPTVAPLDPVNAALSGLLGVQAKMRPGRQHVLDAAYFARVDAIQFTIAHDDGIAWEEWEEADIVLAGVSRSSKTPTSIYLANRGYKTANIPIVVESPRPLPVHAEKAAGRGPDHQRGSADRDPAQPAALAEPGARHRLCRAGGGQSRTHFRQAHVRRQ